MPEKPPAAETAIVASPRDETRAVLALLETQYPDKAAFFKMLAVELQALIDGAIRFTGKDGKDHGVSEAQACSAIIHAARNGQSVAAGHIIYIGDKLYTTPSGYMASAENRGDFKGFAPVRAMTPEELEFMGLTEDGLDPWHDKTTGKGAGERPKGKRYSCAIAIEGERDGYDHPSIGYGWWDTEKDRVSSMTVPAQTAIARARRRCLMGLYSLGTPLGGDIAETSGDVVKAEIVPGQAKALPGIAIDLEDERPHGVHGWDTKDGVAGISTGPEDEGVGSTAEEDDARTKDVQDADFNLSGANTNPDGSEKDGDA